MNTIKSSHTAKLLLKWAGIAVILGVVGLVACSHSLHPSIRNTALTAAPYDVTVRDRTYAASDSEGMRHLRLLVRISNKSADTLQISPGLQMQIVGQLGTAYPMTAHYLAADVSVGGPLVAGASRDEQIDFDIPTGDTATTFVFEYDGSSLPVQVAL